jgi:NADPH-dependent ferric siderophore reductase
MRRVVLAGPPLEGFPVPLPGASVRLLVPSPGADGLVIPVWNGNEFLLPDGRRPALRTFTPRYVDPAAGELTIDVVLHGAGVASGWAATVGAGAPCAVSGPGRGHPVDPAAAGYVLVGDESALPAIAQLLEAISPTTAVRVHVEVAAPEGRLPLPAHPRATVAWHDLADPADPGAAMVAAVHALDLAEDERIWVAGEAASVQRIRRHLFEARGVPRARATVRGYWKRGRPGDGEEP